jgi:uncharacterized protein DUF6159
MILGLPSNPGALPPPDYVSSGGIFRRSFGMARRHPSLALFPLAANFVYCARYLVPIAGSFQRPGAPENSILAAASGLGAVFVNLRNSPHLFAIWAYYFAALLMYTFFTVSLYHELMRVYSSERPSLLQGLRFACGRIGPILSWTALASPAWMMIELGTQNLGVPLRIAAGLCGLAWGLVAIYANAVLLRGKALDPREVLRRSWSAVRRTWIELVALYVCLVLANIALSIFVKVLPGLVHSTDIVRGVTASARSVVRIAVNMMANIYLCTLYIYATEGVEPKPLQQEAMDAAWEIRTQ